MKLKLQLIYVTLSILAQHVKMSLGTTTPWHAPFKKTFINNVCLLVPDCNVLLWNSMESLRIIHPRPRPRRYIERRPEH